MLKRPSQNPFNNPYFRTRRIPRELPNRASLIPPEHVPLPSDRRSVDITPAKMAISGVTIPNDHFKELEDKAYL